MSELCINKAGLYSPLKQNVIAQRILTKLTPTSQQLEGIFLNKQVNIQ